MATIAPSEYARWRASPMGATTERLEQAVVFDLAGKGVLDAGCGDGSYSIEAAKRGAMVTGIDTSADMLDAARQRAGAAGVRIELREGNVTKLPLGDGTFDVVLAVTVLCFVHDADRAVPEMARVLVPGGRLVVGELGRWSTWAAWRRLRGCLGSKTWRAARFRSTAELRRLVEGAGLSVEDVRGSVFYPPIERLASMLAPLDPALSRTTTLGAAFLALAAVTP